MIILSKYSFGLNGSLESPGTRMLILIKRCFAINKSFLTRRSSRSLPAGQLRLSFSLCMKNKMGAYSNVIMHNAEIINMLKKRIDETLKFRNQSERQKIEWQKACADFHAQYDKLAFPGGLSGAYERILSGDNNAIEAALSFLECRPYFYRSGYMFKDIIKKLKKTPLNTSQTKRLDYVLAAFNEYNKRKKA